VCIQLLRERLHTNTHTHTHTQIDYEENGCRKRFFFTIFSACQRWLVVRQLLVHREFVWVTTEWSASCKNVQWCILVHTCREFVWVTTKWSASCKDVQWCILDYFCSQQMLLNEQNFVVWEVSPKHNNDRDRQTDRQTETKRQSDRETDRETVRKVLHETLILSMRTEKFWGSTESFDICRSSSSAPDSQSLVA